MQETNYPKHEIQEIRYTKITPSNVKNSLRKIKSNARISARKVTSNAKTSLLQITPLQEILHAE